MTMILFAYRGIGSGPARRCRTLCATVLLLCLGMSAGIAAANRPNILFVFIDDIGWGDLSCYGSTITTKQGGAITPNLDRLASQGIRFTQGYVASPICSPSRTGVLTGIEPCRYGIYSYLNDKKSNAARNMADWVQPDTVAAPRIFKEAGYRTGQFGKWHMGGGRDVNDAPFPQAYGFEESLVAFEGMGDRVLYKGYGLSDQNADVPGTIEWLEWYEGAPRHTLAALTFITNAVRSGKPFYVHVPYNDTHSPYNVPPGQENDFDHITTDTTGKLFLGELHNLDKQIGRLTDAIDGLGIASNTLMVVVGDNGAPNDALNRLLGRNGGLRGGKGNIYEGGIRELFMVRWPGRVPAGRVNSTSVVSTLDLLPTYCALTGVPSPNAPFAGEDISDIFLGSMRARLRPLYWEYGTVSNLDPASPRLATRTGNLKLLRNPDGTERELYDLSVDPNETANLINASYLAASRGSMETNLMRWYDEVVLGAVGEIVPCAVTNTVAEVIADSFTVPGGNSPGTGFATNSGVNYAFSARAAGAAASGGFGYRLGSAGGTSPRQAADFSITGNRLSASPRNGNGRFELSPDGTAGLNLGPWLAGRAYELRIKMTIDGVGANYSQRMSLSLADGSDLAIASVDLGVQVGSDGAGGLNVFKRLDAASDSGGADINQTLTNGLPIGVPVDLMLKIVDFNGNATDFGSSYEIFVNGARLSTGQFRFNSSTSSRFLIFDVAAHESMVHYDDLQLQVTSQGAGGQICRRPILSVSECVAGTNDSVGVRLFWPAQPGLSVTPEASADLSGWSGMSNSAGEPLKIISGSGSLQWLRMEVPANQADRAFFRLRTE